MLAALRIESLAIIQSLEVRFDRGLNVLTGETGAGKSILVDALGLLLGGRADPGIVRAGCDEAVVEGLFVGAGLRERAASHGLPADGDELLVRRTVARSGRGRVHVNGALATNALLGSLTRGLVDLCGQHEHVSLLKRERHLELLDAYAGLDSARGAYEARYNELVRARRDRERLASEALERARRRDWLEFQLRELDEAAAQPGEDTALGEERRLLASTERLREAAASAENVIYAGEGAAADQVALALRRLEEAARLDERLAPIVALLTAARAELDEAGRSLGRYAAGLAGDPARLAAVDERLEALRRIARKHGGTLEAAVARQAEMRGELDALGHEESRSETLDAEISRLERQVRAEAERLTAARREAAGRFSCAVAEELQRLGLGSATLQVELAAPDGLDLDGITCGPRGAEEGEFSFCANPGEEPRPLVRAASGGELSRVLLALKRVLAGADPVGIWVFDEVDAGISGATGVVVGQMLKHIAAERQVLCVTHLPQVAAHADVHLHVSKEVVGDRTHGRVQLLERDRERQRSLARMLSGSEDRPAALAAAAELLEAARERPARKRRRAA